MFHKPTHYVYRTLLLQTFLVNNQFRVVDVMSELRRKSANMKKN